MKLFCFAYAGGDGHVFLPYVDILKEKNIDLIPFYYTARGARQSEKAYETIHDIAEDAYTFIVNHDLSEGFSILGYSLGALVAYELYYLFEKNEVKKPINIIFCASLPPKHLVQEKIVSKKDTSRLLEKLKELDGGITDELIDNPEIQSYFMPIILNDFIVYEQYIHENKTNKILSNVLVAYGSEDLTLESGMDSWGEVIEGMYNMVALPGNHFFMFDDGSNLKKIINILINDASRGGK